MADRGGTAARDYDGDGVQEDGEGGPGVILPGNEDELVEALTETLSQIREGAASFASAAVPSVQADSADKVFLTEFRPVDDAGLWPGRFYAFVKPVPLNQARRPDLTKRCDSTRTASCFAWEAQEVVVEEQVKPSAGAPLGPAESQRRVYYAEHESGADVPFRRHFLEMPAPNGDVEEDLWRGLGIIGADQEIEAMTSGGKTAARAAADQLVDATLALKTVTPPNSATIEYVLGDNFHSDPLSIGEPNNIRYYVANVGTELRSDSTPKLCSDSAFDADRSYRDFAIRHRNRRRMLALGTNDGMLHVFDTGVYRENDVNPSLPGKFDNGTGRELFAFVPRPLLSRLTDIHAASDPEPIYGVDGRAVAADVLIDPINAGWVSNDEPDRCERRWRTVLMGGLREGSALVPTHERPLLALTQNARAGSYFALDVTRPDAPLVQRDLDGFFFVPEVTGTEPPRCMGTPDGGGLSTDCGEHAFGDVLFEFHDMVRDDDGSPHPIRLDEDDNGHIDLAMTWSTPNLGRIQVCTGNCAAPLFRDRTIEDRYVAVFGGGLDPANPTTRGNWLYMVDVETGQAIYKERLRGAAPAEPAAVDTDLDGYIDRVYIGTTYGFMYRVDLVQGTGTTRVVPTLANVTVSETGADALVRTETVPRISAAAFRPRIFFSASANNAADTVTTVLNSAATMRPIFFRPSVIFVPEIEQYALAFGTGNREDLTLRGVPLARFFTVVDEKSWAVLSDDAASQPLNKAALLQINLASAASTDQNANFLTDRAVNQRGWWMELAADERLITDPTTIVGVLLFSVFSPVEVIQQGVCGDTGTSRLFAVMATNASGLLFTNPDGTPIYGGAPPEEGQLQDPGAAGVLSRYKVVSDLVTQPFAEQSQTKNPPSDLTDFQYGEELLSTSQRQAMEAIQKLLPPNCKFPPGYRVDLKTRDSKTGIEWIAPIPLCVMERNFKDF
jgi:Tfp pilus tip-associated adhesin PilY1